MRNNGQDWRKAGWNVTRHKSIKSQGLFSSETEEPTSGWAVLLSRRVCFSETCAPLHTEPGPQHKQKRPRVHDRSSTELKWKTTYSSEQAKTVRRARGTPNCEGKHLFFNELQRFFFFLKRLATTRRLSGGVKVRSPVETSIPKTQQKTSAENKIFKNPSWNLLRHLFLRKSNNMEEGERHHSGKKWLLTQNMRLGARADAQAWTRAQHWQFKLIQTQRKSKWKPNFSWPSAHCGVSSPSQKDNRGC